MSKIHPADREANEYFEKQERFSGKKENILLTAVFCAFVLATLVLFFLLPKKDYSKTENRALAHFPEFTLQKLADGKFTAGTVSYIKDHFPLREEYVELNALYDLLMLRAGSNGVAPGKDGSLLYMEQEATEKERETLKRNARVLAALSEELPTVTAVAGKGSEILTDRYPFLLSAEPAERNGALIREVLSGTAGDCLDLIPVLRAHADEDVYYRTDHHWTALGAYYASNAILEKLGRAPRPLSDYTKESALSDFKGTLYNRAGLYFLDGEELFFMRYEGDDGYTVTEYDLVEDGTSGELCEKEIAVRNGFYVRERLEKDYTGTAYDAFVTTVNVPVVRIEKKGETRERLLVVKDSFAHSVLPYLARDFDIVSIDVRSNPDYALELIETHQVDRVLILLNSETLFSPF
ncbi:MAG: hypothetical protein IJU52_06550 [Clostridia bacterium]|nr:hypothetical protein [Clostridia bacterium]